MRIVDLSGQPDVTHGDGADGADAGGSPPGMPFGPALISPVAGSGQPQRSSRLPGAVGARRARQRARAEDLRSASSEVLGAARKAGGKRVVSDLTGELGDDWVLVRGYHNSSGQIGQLLLSAHGVVALTSLHLHATVRCHGDKWSAGRFDEDKRPLGESSLDDRAGRSPGTQLNQAADVLEKFLRSSGAEVSVLRAVLLNHPRSRLEDRRQATVEIFSSHFDLCTWMRKLPKVLDRGQRRKIEQLLTNGDRSHGHEH